MRELKAIDMIVNDDYKTKVYLKSEADAYIRKLKWKRCKHNAAIACLMASMLHKDIMKYHKYIGRMLKWRELAENFKEAK